MISVMAQNIRESRKFEIHDKKNTRLCRQVRWNKSTEADIIFYQIFQTSDTNQYHKYITMYTTVVYL